MIREREEQVRISWQAQPVDIDTGIRTWNAKLPNPFEVPFATTAQTVARYLAGADWQLWAAQFPHIEVWVHPATTRAVGIDYRNQQVRMWAFDTPQRGEQFLRGAGLRPEMREKGDQAVRTDYSR